MESKSRHSYGLLWIGLGITVVGVASYFFGDPYKKSHSFAHSQKQEDSVGQAEQLLTLQQVRSERNRFTNWLGIAAMTTGCMLWISSKRRIPFSLLFATGLNLLNSWHAIGIDEESKETSDVNVDRITPDIPASEQVQQFASGLYSH